MISAYALVFLPINLVLEWVDSRLRFHSERGNTFLLGILHHLSGSRPLHDNEIGDEEIGDEEIGEDESEGEGEGGGTRAGTSSVSYELRPEGGLS